MAAGWKRCLLPTARGWIDLLGALDAARARGHAQFRRTHPRRGVANGPRVTSIRQQTLPALHFLHLARQIV